MIGAGRGCMWLAEGPCARADATARRLSCPCHTFPQCNNLRARTYPKLMSVISRDPPAVHCTRSAYSTEYDQLSRTASGDCSSNQVSNTRASSFTLGASYLKIGGSLGVGWSTGTSTSSDRCITGSKMNRDQFAQASAALASYRDSACSGSSGASGSLTDQTLSVLQQTVDPNGGLSARRPRCRRS